MQPERALPTNFGELLLNWQIELNISSAEEMMEFLGIPQDASFAQSWQEMLLGNAAPNPRLAHFLAKAYRQSRSENLPRDAEFLTLAIIAYNRAQQHCLSDCGKQIKVASLPTGNL